MKSNQWLLCGLAWITGASLLAQNTNTPVAPAKTGESYTKDVVLDPPVTATVKDEALNVRGQPNFKGEVIAHVKKGDTVTVLEQMTLKKPKSGEPADWSRIALPADAKAWVFADYIDTNAMTVSSRRINVRGGPSENFSVLARLVKGTPVKEIGESKGWIQIEPPTNAYAFVASKYLVLEAEVAAAAVTAPATATNGEAMVTNTPLAVTNPPVEATNTPVVAATNAPEPMAPPPTATSTNSAPPATADTTVAAAAAISAPPPADDTSVRVVTREGIVRKAINIQAPTYFELRDITSGTLTEYLQPADTNFNAFVGARVTITGSESLDHRWPKTPVLQVQTVFLMP